MVLRSCEVVGSLSELEYLPSMTLYSLFSVSNFTVAAFRLVIVVISSSRDVPDVLGSRFFFGVSRTLLCKHRGKLADRAWTDNRRIVDRSCRERGACVRAIQRTIYIEQVPR